MISAIEHFSYCPRQCALIHVEQVFQENVFTLRGRQEHERADTSSWEETEEGRVERALPLWSERLGLYGRADTVVFRKDEMPYPVEYKHGSRREKRHDDLQLCAQAVCLEEMFGVEVPLGAIYSITSRRRREVAFTAALREEMEEVTLAARAMIQRGESPPAWNDARCPNCSLIDACTPEALVTARLGWHARALYRIDLEEEGSQE